MGSGGLVGRRQELAVLADALRAADSGRPQVVVISGEAGAGKTRLLEEFAGQAEGSGVRVLRSACVELGVEGLPLAPVTAVLRRLVEETGTSGLAELLPGVDRLLGLLPELAGEAPADREPGGQVKLFELFEALLRRLGAERTLVLAVDDLQWADRSTRELLGMLARTLGSARVLLAAAYRSDDAGRGHPLRPFLAGLARLPGVRRVEVGRFSRAETGELVANLLGQAPGDAALDRLYRRSGGNPFFAEELARAPADEAVPESLRDLLTDRVERLPAPTREVVRLAAVGGERVSHGLLSAAAGAAEAELLPAVRVAAKAGVLVPDHDGYAFQHRLLREAIVDDLLPAERARLHRTYAEALVADPWLVPPDRLAAELAFHWYGAGVATEALPALLRAAEAAERVYAYAEQAWLLDRALQLSASDVDRMDLFERAIGAATWAGEDFDALALIDQALVEVDRVRQPGRAALLLAHRGMILQSLGRDGSQTAVEEGLALLPDDRSLARARVLDLAGAVLAMRGSAEHAHALVEEAARLATEHGELGLAINAQNTLAWARNQLGRYEEGKVALHAARKFATEADDPVQLVRTQLNLADGAHRLGDYPAVTDAARGGLELAGRAGVARTLGMLLAAQLVAALFATGRWDEAGQAASRAIDQDPAGMLGSTLHGQRAELALARGELDQAREQLSLARALGQLGGGSRAGAGVHRPGEPVRPGLARLEAMLALPEHRLDDARAQAIASLPAGVENSAAPYEVWPLLTTAARVNAQLAPDPEPLADRLRTVASALAVDTPLYQAYAAQLAAELGEAGAEWASVAAAWDRLGRPHEVAHSNLRAAEANLRASDPGAARAQLRSADEQADQLGAAPLRDEVRALARSARITLARAEPQAAQGEPLVQLGLTERELEVLRLVTAGRSNRRIGEELFISPKTVSVHVSNLLSKLGVANRGEATALAHRLHLFDD